MGKIMLAMGIFTGWEDYMPDLIRRARAEQSSVHLLEFAAPLGMGLLTSNKPSDDESYPQASRQPALSTDEQHFDPSDMPDDTAEAALETTVFIESIADFLRRDGLTVTTAWLPMLDHDKLGEYAHSQSAVNFRDRDELETRAGAAVVTLRKHRRFRLNPKRGVLMIAPPSTNPPARPSHQEIPEPRFSRFLFANTLLAPLWATIRIYLGYEWLTAGWEKLTNPAGIWVGEKAGATVTGFLNGALQKTDGAHPDMQGYSAWFFQNVALPNAALFSYLVTFGEIAVGLALIVGLFTGIAAFFGGFLSAMFLFAGTVSTNPLMFVLATLLVLAWRTAEYWGFDRFALPWIGVPGESRPLRAGSSESVSAADSPQQRP